METYSRIGPSDAYLTRNRHRFSYFVDLFSNYFVENNYIELVKRKKRGKTLGSIYTRFEFILRSLHSFRVYFKISPLVSSVFLKYSPLFRVYFKVLIYFTGQVMNYTLNRLNYTRNEWGRCVITLETSGEKFRSLSFWPKVLSWLLITGPIRKVLHSCRV